MFDRATATAAHECAVACLEAGIRAADPERAVAERLTLDSDVLRVDGVDYDLASYDRVVLLGVGKASVGVARALDALLGERLDDGLVVADAAADLPWPVVVGGHPTPDGGSLEGGERALDLVRSAGERASAGDRVLVLAAVTGGASALMEVPAGELTLGDIRDVTGALLGGGATIDETNAVRKHCSAVKGGRLARAAAPADVCCLLVSDVVGDDPSVIASGPFSPDQTGYEDARSVLDRHGVTAEAVRTHLEREAKDGSETPGDGDACFDSVRTFLLAGAHTALAAAGAEADRRGYRSLLLSSRVRGEAREQALAHAAVAEESLDSGSPVEPPAVVLSGGETTVRVRGTGTGGPNLEFALGAALALPRGCVVGAVDTDGRDGSTDAAGALVDAATVTDRGAARAALEDNASFEFLERRGALLRSGATGTNVNDLRVLVVE